MQVNAVKWKGKYHLRPFSVPGELDQHYFACKITGLCAVAFSHSITAIAHGQLRALAAAYKSNCC